ATSVHRRPAAPARPSGQGTWPQRARRRHQPADARHHLALVSSAHRRQVRWRRKTWSRSPSHRRVGWGYTRLRDALGNLGHVVGRNTIKRILKDHGLSPAPERGKRMPWKTFIKAHLGAIAGIDFFNVEVLSLAGLVRYYVLFVIASRRAAFTSRASFARRTALG